MPAAPQPQRHEVQGLALCKSVSHRGIAWIKNNLTREESPSFVEVCIPQLALAANYGLDQITRPMTRMLLKYCGAMSASTCASRKIVLAFSWRRI